MKNLCVIALMSLGLIFGAGCGEDDIVGSYELPNNLGTLTFNADGSVTKDSIDEEYEQCKEAGF